VGARFAPRELPNEDIAAYVSRQVSVAPRRFPATFRLHAPLEAMQAKLTAAVGTLERVDEHTCVLKTANDSLEQLAVYISLTGVDFEVVEPVELVEHFRTLADRYRRAVSRADT
jgi:predicted DNA-binding transcriptional regulator YafY